MFRRKSHPKDEPVVSQQQAEDDAIICAMNGLERAIDPHKRLNETNMIIEDRKWGLFRRCVAEQNRVPFWDEKLQRWV